LMQSAAVKEFCKSIKNWQSYSHGYGGTLFSAACKQRSLRPLSLLTWFKRRRRSRCNRGHDRSFYSALPRAIASIFHTSSSLPFTFLSSFVSSECSSAPSSSVALWSRCNSCHCCRHRRKTLLTFFVHGTFLNLLRRFHFYNVFYFKKRWKMAYTLSAVADEPARCATSRQTCCKQRRTLSVINMRPN